MISKIRGNLRMSQKKDSKQNKQVHTGLIVVSIVCLVLALIVIVLFIVMKSGIDFPSIFREKETNQVINEVGNIGNQNKIDKAEQNNSQVRKNQTENDAASTKDEMNTLEENQQQENNIQKEVEKKEKEVLEVIEEADKLALGYYYEEAIEKVKSYPDYEENERFMNAITRYKKEKDSLVVYDGPVNHVFFHSLIADNSKAFDGDAMSNGYNYWMTTVSEFNKILEQMYERGYVLVDIHDVAGPVEVDGKTVFKQKEIYLPKGKKPFVLSQDDVNYYEYMKTDGFATRLVLDEQGKVACEIRTDQGIKVARDYDVVPLLDVFVEEHPDFSYRGAKGILALTGYEGALGYRTNDPDSPTYKEDKKAVKELAKVLKEDGWEFASHSYTHRHMKQVSEKKFIADCDKWKKQVESLVGETDIYIYPYGEEIDYKGVKYNYLKEQGFNYFCGVYAKPWMEIGKDYVRMTRRNLDGFTMHFYPDRVKDLYDLDYVFDKERPEFK